MDVRQNVFGQPSARVIALARLGLAIVFLAGTLADPDATAGPAVFPVLCSFVVFSLGIAIATWKNWWVDARIALSTHIIDVTFFVTVIGVPQGYSSPYFLFFVFLLLSPAIRWTWRETAVTAAVVIFLYIVAGLLPGLIIGSPFDERRFIIRSGYLLILSVVLIWFGLRRRFSEIAITGPSIEGLPSDRPLFAAMRLASTACGADECHAYWTGKSGDREACDLADGRLSSSAAWLDVPKLASGRPFLFDGRKNRALLAGTIGSARYTSVASLLGEEARRRFASHQGIAMPIKNDLGAGVLLLCGVHDLHSDHLQLAERLGPDLTAAMERAALFAALRDSAVARERFALARDLHDGVVQFLAGASYRVEAISRTADIPILAAHSMRELKQLMIMEQEDLRTSIGMLRREDVDADDALAAIEALCERLGRQWHMKCLFSADVSVRRLPAAVQMSLLSIVKECVANAVRHAAAATVRIDIRGTASLLELTARNAMPAGVSEPAAIPWSIRERIQEMGGNVTVKGHKGETVLRVEIHLQGAGE